MRFLRRLLGSLIALIAVAVACPIVIISYPQPLFAHSLRTDHLELWSDKPFDAQSGHRLLADVTDRLRQSPLYHGDGVHRIFVVNQPWRRYVTFLWKHSVGGLNYYPITRNVFIREADISTGQVIGPGGNPVAPPRTLAYYAAHEIGHSLIGEAVGIWRHQNLAAWVNEGMADRVALPNQDDLDELREAYERNDPSLSPQKSGLYHRYRLLVNMAIERHGWSPAELLASPMTQEEAEAAFLTTQ